ncbi:hypothetical protein IQ07DRAFT_631667 [Pyrenochaeta sp. DS3sAY3a]|nr:hypothetical protein IQ07DRAFT_631667 [Pyrenochaeta sp. DS3sAY3a]
MMISRQMARDLTATITRCRVRCAIQCTSPHRNYSVTSKESSELTENKSLSPEKNNEEQTQPKKKTQAELDEELQRKLQGLAGDGGDAGIEYEDGKPVSMKRSGMREIKTHTREVQENFVKC